MTILMPDGINALAAGIARQFPDAAKVAGYVNGTYAWTQAEWNLFPHADHVTISVTASANAGDVLDVEAGDATPSQSGGWIAMRKAAGLYRPTIYCSRSVIPAVRAGTGTYILGKDYDIWVAEYTGQPHEVTAPGTPAANCAATQYESTADYDVSMVYDTAWPHRHAAVPLPPGGLSATPHELVNMAWSASPGKSYQWQLATRMGLTVVREGNVTATLPVVHVTGADAGLPAPYWYRVRELPDGQWTAWSGLKG
jgi:hypothetical protein